MLFFAVIMLLSHSMCNAQNCYNCDETNPRFRALPAAKPTPASATPAALRPTPGVATPAAFRPTPQFGIPAPNDFYMPKNIYAMSFSK
uniref:Uncharacterized protein n=1 Tax=Ditylenchus dipsaci TaxID=166011 RepID=A0A915DNI7_9BILA